MLDIMDTAGQEEYSALRDQYMKTGQGFILAYSITSGISFETAHKLRMQILRIKEDAQDIPIMLVGNKVDLEDERVVSKDEGEEMSKRCKSGFIEVRRRIVCLVLFGLGLFFFINVLFSFFVFVFVFCFFFFFLLKVFRSRPLQRTTSMLTRRFTSSSE